MQLDSEQLARVLAVAPVARLASIGADGAPHVVPIVFAAVDGDLYSPIDGKPKRDTALQRLRNVAHHPGVSLVIDRYEADWRRLWWVRIDATARAVTSADVSAETWQRVVAALRGKYRQYATVPLFEGVPTLLRMTPHRHAAWSAQPLDWRALDWQALD